MKRMPVSEMNDEQLVERFVAIGEAQDDAKLYDDIPEYNRLYDLKIEVVEELQKRPGDLRTLLLPLYHHKNLYVRFNAATGTLALAPEEGRRVLQEIADSKKQPYAGEAGMTLRALDKGIFKPT